MEIFPRLIKIPVIKDILLVFNAYLWRGDTMFVSRFAPLSSCFSRLWARLGLALFTTFIFYGYDFIPRLNFFLIPISEPSIGYDLVLSIFPNLLGFGLGVYALIFSLPGLLDRKNSKNTQSSNLLNADMGYPLLMMVIAILVSLIAKACDGNFYLADVSFFLLIYGTLLLLELISLIFMGAAKAINK